ncbi:Shedu immune nuclease family protein [Faecalibacterium prausnitzii]|jgi:hypothetical protein BATR1942_00120|uniref:Shedu immune nuclease family protein n=1 Tax=Faecalibacterium prausnitzii TaxID=853 RepID=UPI00291106AB|nr:Shedu immune nuclease family protein [Faecalibacterium prausnitzii]MDU8668524.1 Shedu immune nuclease family protein [Faecalibacterium prausnitzii]
MKESCIDVVSRSAMTADATPVVLSSTERFRFRFMPMLVDNQNNPEQSVRGKLLLERKSKNEKYFPTDSVAPCEKVTRGSAKNGDWVEIELHSEETYNLFMGLKKLYDLSGCMNGIPFGSARFAQIDSSFSSFLEVIQNDPSAARMIGEPQNFELIKILLQLITQTSSHESLKNSLSSLANENLQALTTSASLEGLKRVEALMRENLDNGKEEFWQQKVFNENQWVLAQIFSCPCTIYAQKAFVGGKSLDNKGGNVCDFIYRNKMTQNVALIEIKTPCTEIVGKPYRETYSMSLDMSGAVNQVLNYRDELQKNFSTLTRDLEEADTVRAFSPKCVVVIGKISTLNAKQQKAFELYRNSFNNLTIITFDELHQKICDLMSVFKEDSPRPVDSLMDEFSIIDEDYPI